MASKLGDFFVELGAKPNTAGIKSFGSSLNGLLGTVGKIYAGILGLGGAVLIGTHKMAKEMAELSRSAKDVGASAKELDMFQNMFKLAGLNAEQAKDTISELNAQVLGFKFGEYKEQLGIKLGLAPQDFSGKFLKDFELIKERLNQRYKPEEKEAVLSEIGLGGALRLLRLTNAEYEDIKKQSQELGLLTEAQAKSAERYMQSFARLSIIVKTIKRDLAEISMPGITGFMDSMTNLINKNRSEIKIFSEYFLQTLSAVSGLSLFKEIVDNTDNKKKQKGESLTPYSNFEKLDFSDKIKYLFLSSEKQRQQMINNVTNNINVNVAQTNATAEDIAKKTIEAQDKIKYKQAKESLVGGGI